MAHGASADERALGSNFERSSDGSGRELGETFARPGYADEQAVGPQRHGADVDDAAARARDVRQHAKRIACAVTLFRSEHVSFF